MPLLRESRLAVLGDIINSFGVALIAILLLEFHPESWKEDVDEALRSIGA